MPVLVDDHVAWRRDLPAVSGARAPRSLGECLADLAEVLLASHPQAAELWTDFGDAQQRARLQQRSSPRSR